MGARIAIVGEAPGEQEETVGLPFQGYSGQELTRMLSHEDVGIERKDCYLTNVFFSRPPNNKLFNFCGAKEDGIYGYPPLDHVEKPEGWPGRYVRKEFQPELDRLYSELRECKPNLIIALGNTATWALLKETKISRLRGKVTFWENIKVLPTYHPSAILRQWDLRVIMIADLMKARQESLSSTYSRPRRSILINPSLGELYQYRERLLTTSLLSCDIETNPTLRQITCIGFAPSVDEAIVIPFLDMRAHNKHYWQDMAKEVEAWKFVKEILEHPVEKVFQNGMYDLQYIYEFGIRPKGCYHDTMLIHHALYPEMTKSLDFLASIYTNEASWKQMRKEGNKRDE